ANIPRTVEHAKLHLDGQAVGPFAKLAIAGLKDVRPKLEAVVRAVKPLLAVEGAGGLDSATEPAIAALESLRGWLEARLPAMPTATAVGRDAYADYLKNVALMPFTPEQLLAMGRQEWERAVAFEAYEQRRNAGLPQLPLFPSQAAQIQREERDEHAIREFLE